MPFSALNVLTKSIYVNKMKNIDKNMLHEQDYLPTVKLNYLPKDISR